MTSEYMENEIGTAEVSQPYDETHDTAGAAEAAPYGEQDDAGYEALEGHREDGREQVPDLDDADAEAEALFEEMDAAISEEMLASDDTEDMHGDLDSVPVALSFELGKVSLPLAEVRTLGPGGVVLFSGGSPASIAIVSAGRILGRGELVDVEGRLGIRVTQWSKPC